MVRSVNEWGLSQEVPHGTYLCDCPYPSSPYPAAFVLGWKPRTHYGVEGHAFAQRGWASCLSGVGNARTHGPLSAPNLHAARIQNGRPDRGFIERHQAMERQQRLALDVGHSTTIHDFGHRRVSPRCPIVGFDMERGSCW